jgi:hypothetical protein
MPAGGERDVRARDDERDEERVLIPSTESPARARRIPNTSTATKLPTCM